MDGLHLGQASEVPLRLTVPNEIGRVRHVAHSPVGCAHARGAGTR
jgi:hypothetical protein